MKTLSITTSSVIARRTRCGNPVILPFLKGVPALAGEGFSGLLRVLAMTAGILLVVFALGAKTASASVLQKLPNELGLVGRWSLDDGAGTKAGDSSGQGNTGTLTGGPTWVQGKLGKALSFDGTDESIISVNNSRISGDAVFTISAWIKPNDLTGLQSVASFGDGSVSLGTGAIFFNPNGNGSFGASFAGGNNASSASGVITTAGQWYHLVITKTAGAINTTSALYLNGQSVAIVAASSNTPNIVNQKVAIGEFTTTLTVVHYYFNGSIDDVRIYNRALSATEVASLYARTGYGKIKNAASGLVAHYPMSEGAGSITADATGQGNTGTLTGGPTWASGKFGNGLSFDGTDDYVDAGNAVSLTPSSGITVSAWVKTTDTGTFRGVVDKWNATAGGSGYMIDLQASGANQGKPRFSIGSQNSLAGITSSVVINDGQWHLVTATCDNTNGVIYIDGISRGSGSYTMTGISSTDNLKIVGDNTSTFYLNGSIDDVRIYNRALSAAEVATLYNSTGGEARGIINGSQNNKLTNGLVGMWSFNGRDLSGITAFDRAGTNNGTLTNGPTVTAGKIGQALKFDGTDDVVDLGTGTMGISAGSTGLTLSTWVKVNTFRSYDGMISKTTTSGPYGGWQLNVDSATRFDFAVNVSGTWQTVENLSSNAGSTNSTGVWYHVVGTYDGSTVKLYKNGVLDASAAAAGTIQYQNSAGNIYVAKNGGAATTFDGSIDEVRIYNRALSAAEVGQLYRMGQ